MMPSDALPPPKPAIVDLDAGADLPHGARVALCVLLAALLLLAAGLHAQASGPACCRLTVGVPIVQALPPEWRAPISPTGSDVPRPQATQPIGSHHA